jgi:serine/threonine protein kinase
MSKTVPRESTVAPTRVGEVIDGRWRLVARLGGGGMGEVYRAEHVSLGRVVAVKVLRAELASSAMYARRVLREGQAATLVSHPNIVRVEDLGIDEKGMPYLVQEYLDGIDLATYAQYRRGPVPSRDLIPLMLPVLDALAVLHDAGVVHRDLKPENVFLVRDGAGWSPRLLDFGLAVIAEHHDDQPRITGSDVTLGSPAYMSPEQFRDPRSLTPRSDLWSIGVMFYELLCGVLPFQGHSVGSVAIAVANETPIPLQRRVPGIAPHFAAVLMSCLEKDPARRPASARALMEVLSETHASLPPPVAEEDLAPTERRSALSVSPGPAISPVPPSPPPPSFAPRPASYVVDDPMPTMPLGLVRPARPAQPEPAAVPKATEEFLLARPSPRAARRRRAWAIAIVATIVGVGAVAIVAWQALSVG